MANSSLDRSFELVTRLSRETAWPPHSTNVDTSGLHRETAADGAEHGIHCVTPTSWAAKRSSNATALNDALFGSAAMITAHLPRRQF